MSKALGGSVVSGACVSGSGSGLDSGFGSSVGFVCSVLGCVVSGLVVSGIFSSGYLTGCVSVGFFSGSVFSVCD